MNRDKVAMLFSLCRKLQMQVIAVCVMWMFFLCVCLFVVVQCCCLGGTCFPMFPDRCKGIVLSLP